MNLIETRGNDGKKPKEVTFAQAILNPSASFGGLYVPEEFPKIDNQFLKDYVLEIRKKLIRFAKEFYEWVKNGGEKPEFEEITRDIAVAIKNGEISPYLSITILNVNNYINGAIKNL